jgi:hypothetical protein
MGKGAERNSGDAAEPGESTAAVSILNGEVKEIKRELAEFKRELKEFKREVTKRLDQIQAIQLENRVDIREAEDRIEKPESRLA